MTRRAWGHAGAIALIGIWGLVPLRWFLPGHIIHTVDLEIPISMAQWLAMASTWKSQWGTGAEWSITLPALVPYLIPAVTHWITGSLEWAQKLEFVVWFLLPGLSMYTLMVCLTKSWAARLVAAHLYMFNLALASQWPGGQSALIAYAFLPWVVTLIVRGMRAGPAWWLYAVGLGLLAGVGAGIGVNFAQAYVFVLAVLLLVACSLVAHRGTPEGSSGRCATFLTVAAIVGLGCNAFWMLPQAAAAKLRIADPAIADIKGWSGGWLEGISANASLPNVLRFQGDWTWFQGWKEPYVLYAEWYRTTPWLIALSWLPAALALIGCLTNRGWFVGYCALTAVIGLIWSTGVHPPFRPLYLWCVEHVPLFWIVRSPWFKFTLMTSFGYAVLGGLAAGTLSRWVAARKAGVRQIGRVGLAAAGVAALIIMAHSTYAHPLILGRMFPKPAERREVLPSHVAMPPEVAAAAAWVNTAAPHGRFLCLPYRVNGSNVYRWGFSGPAPILYHYTDAAYLFSAFSWFAADYGNRLAEEFYAALYDRMTPDAVQLLRLLGVDYLLQEDDVAHDYFEARHDDAAFIRDRVGDLTGVAPVKTIGPRAFYRVSNTRPLVYAADRIVEMVGVTHTLVPLQVKGRSNISEEPGVRSGLVPLTLTDLLDGHSALVFPAEARMLPETLPVQDVVIYNGAPPGPVAEAAVEAGAGLTLFATSDGFAEELAEGRLRPDVAAVAEWIALGPVETGPDGGRWRWQTYAVPGEPQLILDNRTRSPLVTNVQLSIATYRCARDVEIFLNKVRLLGRKVAPERPETILLRAVTLQPGRNVVGFATPHAAERRGDTSVTYAISDDVSLGDLTLAATLQVPRAGVYQLHVHPAPWTAETPAPLELALDGRPVDLPYRSARDGYAGQVTIAAPGAHTVRMQHAVPGTRYLIHCAQSGAVAPEAGRVTFQRSAPTDVSVEVVTDRPGLIVLNESFHPAWEARWRDPATGRTRTLPHLLVNGFANGYLLEPPGTHQITFRFALQDLYERGRTISLIVFALAAAALAFGLLARRHKIR